MKKLANLWEKRSLKKKNDFKGYRQLFSIYYDNIRTVNKD